MNEAKIASYLFAGLLVATIILFSWTCLYVGDVSSQANPPATVAAFNG